MMDDGIQYVDYLISKTEEMTKNLAESTDSEGIRADMGYRNPSSSSGRGSMTSSINNNLERMFLSTMSTPRRQASRIPALMTKSLHAPRSSSTPSTTVYGSGEQLCEDFQEFKSEFRRHHETEILLSRSQEKRQMRASSYDPRCLVSLQPSSLRLSVSSPSNQFLPMTSSCISSASYSRLLPKRPQWVRNANSSQILLAESCIMKPIDKFYLNSDSESSDSESDDVDLDSEDVTPRRRRKQMTIRRMKEKNRKKFRNSIRRLQPPPSSPQKLQYPTESTVIPADFLCVSSPIFYLLIAFLFRILLFFSENFL